MTDVLIAFPLSVYSLDSVKRAAYTFTDRYSFDINLVDDEIVCVASPIDGVDADQTTFIRRLRNAVLDQDLREQVARQTESVRNVILAHAFSKTGLQD